MKTANRFEISSLLEKILLKQVRWCLTFVGLYIIFFISKLIFKFKSWLKDSILILFMFPLGKGWVLLISDHIWKFPIFPKRPSWSWSYRGWIYSYLCNRCLSPLTLGVWTLFMTRCTLYNIMCQVCQWLVAGKWFSPDTPVSSNKNWLPQYNWNMFESGFKYHNHNPYFLYIFHVKLQIFKIQSRSQLMSDYDNSFY